MAENSKIEWCSHTFNPWRGCSKVSEGCKFCYAEKLSHRNPGTLGVWGDQGKRMIAAESYWRQPLKWDREAQAAGERRRVFCASLADVFEDRPELDEPRLRLLGLTAKTPHLDWLLLTKRPERIIPLLMRAVDGPRGPADVHVCGAIRAEKWIHSNYPPNIWLGVSVEDKPRADERIPLLLQTPAAVRFLSCEPLLGPIEFSDVTRRSDAVKQLGKQALDGIGWIICGGESGPHARPMHPDWARSLRRQCQPIGMPFFFKQWGEWKPISEMTEAEQDSLYRSNRLARPGEDQSALDDGYGRTCRIPTVQLQHDGREGAAVVNGHPSMLLFKVGKKAGGRLLDGREWSQFPAVPERSPR